MMFGRKARQEGEEPFIDVKKRPKGNIYTPWGMLRRIFDSGWQPTTNGKEEVFDDINWKSKWRH